jgi:hypothetical protein
VEAIWDSTKYLSGVDDPNRTEAISPSPAFTETPVRKESCLARWVTRVPSRNPSCSNVIAPRLGRLRRLPRNPTADTDLRGQDPGCDSKELKDWRGLCISGPRGATAVGARSVRKAVPYLGDCELAPPPRWCCAEMPVLPDLESALPQGNATASLPAMAGNERAIHWTRPKYTTFQVDHCLIIL